MKRFLTIALLIFPTIVLSELPILVDSETEKYLENLGTNTKDQFPESKTFDQNKNQHLLDSINKRNNPIAQYGKGYLRDSHNKRNRPNLLATGPYNQNENQYIRDSLNKRNNPIAHHGEQFLRDSMNDRNNLVRRYGKIDDRSQISNNPFYATHGPVSMRTLYEW